MATVSELQEMRAALVAARATGAMRTTFKSGGTERTTEYRSDKEMAAALAAIDSEIASLSGRQRVREFYPVLHKGL